jgi:hypothetical protein
VTLLLLLLLVLMLAMNLTGEAEQMHKTEQMH